MFRKALIPLLAIVVIISCNKSVTEEIHKDVIIGNNTIPPYNGVSTLEAENYINKLYIDLLGYEPTDSELATHTATLAADTFSENAKLSIINTIMGVDAYWERLGEIFRAKLLNNASPVDINQYIDLYTMAKTQAMQAGDSFQADLIDFEINKLQNLSTAELDLKNSQITISEFIDYHLYNAIYDEINMGNQNFVLSCFENLFFRFPTETELTEGIKMVGNQGAQILLKSGNSKLDFIHIITGDREFYQGLVLDAYLQYLAATPEDGILAEVTDAFILSDDYQTMQKNILKQKDYAGF